MKTLTKIKPYSNEQMTWDEESQKYYLNIEYCKNEFEDTFRDDEVYKKRIKKNSKIVYRWINYHINSYNRPVVFGVLHGTQEGRKLLLDMLTSQMEADVQTGYNDLSSTPAINVSTGRKDFEREDLYGNQVTVDTQEIWESSADYVGFNLSYQAKYPYTLFVLFGKSL